uniref:Uncharacterized protein n=1 Tax=Caulerpa lentillifera TaxID=148947 RepID=A0A2Z2QKK4_9CHLO|nr:hypothetical protein [Caulerpa lentillifera]AST24277.1 hypothetical protein [Caulerpa lentillifera]
MPQIPPGWLFAPRYSLRGVRPLAFAQFPLPFSDLPYFKYPAHAANQQAAELRVYNAVRRNTTPQVSAFGASSTYVLRKDQDLAFAYELRSEFPLPLPFSGRAQVVWVAGAVGHVGKAAGDLRRRKASFRACGRRAPAH